MAVSEINRISPGQIQLGEPLPWSVVDKNGTLLLRKGVIITIPRHIEMLMQRGMYRSETEDTCGEALNFEIIPVFEQMDTLIFKLKRLFPQIAQGKLAEDLPTRLGRLTEAIDEAVEQDPGASVAALHLDYTSPYLIVHHLQGAILSCIMMRALQVPEDQRRSVLCAALTRDIALFAAEEQLSIKGSQLPPSHKQLIQNHPAQAVAHLTQLGVKDPIWLNSILHHHERLDGSGYPKGLSGEGVPLGARLLAITDTYSAMVKERPYRKAIHATNALREIFLAKDNKLDEKLAKVLIRELGTFPPGSIVRLANKEIAVVKQNDRNLKFPIVYSIYDAKGMPQLEPKERNTNDPTCSIVSMLHASDCKSAQLILRRLWTLPGKEEE